MSASKILELTPSGLYCEAGDFYIDPVRKVSRAVITHGHSDHARAGHDAVLATRETLDVMQARYAERYARAPQPVRYGQATRLGGATITLRPAGHVIGSAQVQVEVKGNRIVVSGDFKRAPDPTCPPFEPVSCDIFVTEATFGLPIFNHPPAADEIRKLLSSLELFNDRAHFIAAYSLGKAQRVIAILRQAGHDAPVFVDKPTAVLCAIYERHGIPLGCLKPLEGQPPSEMNGRIIIAAPSSRDAIVAASGAPPVTSFASGWMRVKKRAKAGGGDLPLIISDHADWSELTRTATELSPQQLWITHGEERALIAWAQARGMIARPLSIAARSGEHG